VRYKKLLAAQERIPIKDEVFNASFAASNYTPFDTSIDGDWVECFLFTY
jgi:hypothetical protein